VEEDGCRQRVVAFRRRGSKYGRLCSLGKCKVKGQAEAMPSSKKRLIFRSVVPDYHTRYCNFLLPLIVVLLLHRHFL